MRIHGVTAEEMSEIDRRAQEEYGISQAVLMENAGKAVAEEIIKDMRLSSVVSCQSSAKIAVLCGKGNNGGDGLVAARLLSKSCEAITVFTTAIGGGKEGAAADNLKIAQSMKLDIMPLSGFTIHGFDAVVDALFGTGFKGELDGEYAKAGEALNASRLRIYAVDIPSGLDATTGNASQNTPRAFKTVAFGLPKQGFYLNDGPRVCGEIVVKDIGFPQELLAEYSS